jgi:hypothetical protein
MSTQMTICMEPKPLSPAPADLDRVGLVGPPSSPPGPARSPLAIHSWTETVIELPEDFRDLLLSLAEHAVEFVVVGGHAVAFHGHIRATKDLDVLVRTTPKNAERVYRALAAFGAPVEAFNITAADFASYEGVLHSVCAG